MDSPNETIPGTAAMQKRPSPQPIPPRLWRGRMARKPFLLSCQMISNRTFRTLAAAIAALLGSPTCVEANDVEFRARIDDIKITRQFDKETIVTGVDPRFVVKLTLEQDVEGIGKRGETVSFAIHSPARDLRITNQRAAAGTRIHLRFSHSKENGFKFLRRISANKARAVAPPGDPP